MLAALLLHVALEYLDKKTTQALCAEHIGPSCLEHDGCIWTFEKCKVDPARLDPCDVKKKKKCNKRDACVWVGKACMMKGSNAAITAQLEDMQAQLQDTPDGKEEVAGMLQEVMDALQDGPKDDGAVDEPADEAVADGPEPNDGRDEDSEQDEAPPADPLPPGAFSSWDQLYAAVDEWGRDETTAETTHGAISGWDTSRVEDMSRLFGLMSEFDTLLNWDTSRVTTLRSTFFGAYAFNQALDWDTSKVTTMFETFHSAYDFNQPLAWDTSKVTTMSHMFSEAFTFSQQIGGWDVASVADFENMFTGMLGGDPSMGPPPPFAMDFDTCLKEDIFVSWGVLQRNKGFAETYASWAPDDLKDSSLVPGTCDARRRLSYEAPADAKVAALEATNNELKEKMAALEAKFAALEAELKTDA